VERLAFMRSFIFEIIILDLYVIIEGRSEVGGGNIVLVKLLEGNPPQV
jgi:hypothetical protein